MAKMTITFSECEHGEDLRSYEQGLISCGAFIVDSKIDSEEEIGVITISTPNYNEFMKAFEETEDFHFSSLCD